MATPSRVLSTRELGITLKNGPPTQENPSGITISPYKFRISKSRNEMVSWVCDDPNVKFTVDFNFAEGSPFYEKQFTRDYPCSGLVRRDAVGLPQVFRFSVTIGNKTHNTPEGQVDP